MKRQPLSAEHRMRIGATSLGITLAEYQANVDAGRKWCFKCRVWRDRDGFPKRAAAADGLSNECRACINPRARETMRRLYARRRAESVAS